jgi:acetyl-CoA C-acetyltransferase
MTQVPFLLPDVRDGYRLGDVQALDGILRDGLTDIFTEQHMGVLTERVAKRMDVSRADQDAFALRSQQYWAAADAAAVFSDEITPIEVKTRKGSDTVARDEHPRPDTTAEALASLRPAFAKDGTITAGNASGINDGAAALLLASEAGLKGAGLKPMARLTGWSSAGVPPEDMGLGPVAAVRKLLEQTGTTTKSIDLVELNEAFAAQSLACVRELELDMEKVNVHGGAIAMGHPIGASGARIVVTLLNALRQREKKTGLATLCIGGGMGMAALFDRC